MNIRSAAALAAATALLATVGAAAPATAATPRVKWVTTSATATAGQTINVTMKCPKGRRAVRGGFYAFDNWGLVGSSKYEVSDPAGATPGTPERLGHAIARGRAWALTYTGKAWTLESGQPLAAPPGSYGVQFWSECLLIRR